MEEERKDKDFRDIKINGKMVLVTYVKIFI